jgi:hypothetical protein
MRSKASRCISCLLAISALAVLAACSATTKHGGWFALRWMEQPSANGPSTEVLLHDLAYFEPVLSYDAKSDDASFDPAEEELREGDLIAYRMTFWDAYRDILTLKFNKLPYRLFKYGHLALVVQDPESPSQLRLFSSDSFRGVNVKDDLGSLKDFDFDVYRPNDWKRVDRSRLNEFVAAVVSKAGKWSGYDFLGMFGMNNSSMRPQDAQMIGRDFTCSTVVVSALFYAGLDLDAIRREGFLDIVTPQQVVESRGRYFPSPAGTFIVESGLYDRDPDLH